MSKIFVLGYNKTGTKSLADALVVLGYHVLHTGGGGEFLEMTYKNMKNNRGILFGYEEYDCYLDYPIFEPIVFSHIVDEYSDAKYISLTRGYDDYVESVLKDKIKRLDEGIENSWNWLGVGEVEVFENYPQYQKDWIKEKTMFKHISNLKDALNWCDVANVLRIQLERQDVKYFPSLREYAMVFGINKEILENLDKEITIMHPGPINRGVELTSDVADSGQAIILDQVENGVAIRMAALYLLAGKIKKNAK